MNIGNTADKRQRSNFGLGHAPALRPDGADASLHSKLAAAVAAGDREHVFQLAAKLVQTPIAQIAYDEELLSLTAVAELLTCGTRTVWRLIARNELRPPIHVGGGARWFRKDIQEYLDRMRSKRGQRQKA